MTQELHAAVRLFSLSIYTQVDAVKAVITLQDKSIMY